MNGPILLLAVVLLGLSFGVQAQAPAQAPPAQKLSEGAKVGGVQEQGCQPFRWPDPDEMRHLQLDRLPKESRKDAERRHLRDMLKAKTAFIFWWGDEYPLEYRWKPKKEVSRYWKLVPCSGDAELRFIVEWRWRVPGWLVESDALELIWVFDREGRLLLDGWSANAYDHPLFGGGDCVGVWCKFERELKKASESDR